MLENHKDKEATKAARRSHRFQNYESWISLAGHQYLSGVDKSELRDRIMKDAKFTCAICGETCLPFQGDLDHIKGGSMLKRCDCYHTQLSDGTTHNNLQWIHGMFSPQACHVKKHRRIISWSKHESR